jgi:hypothetical protein
MSVKGILKFPIQTKFHSQINDESVVPVKKGSNTLTTHRQFRANEAPYPTKTDTTTLPK